MINRELWMSYLKGRISKISLRFISGCKSKYLFGMEYKRAVYKWGIKSGSVEKIRGCGI